NRAETGGPSYEATLTKIASLFDQNWQDLLAEPLNPFEAVNPAELFPNLVHRRLISPAPFHSCDETAEADKIRSAIDTLLSRKIPFFIIAIAPANSIALDVLLDIYDAYCIDLYFDHGFLQTVISAIHHLPPLGPSKTTGWISNALHALESFSSQPTNIEI